MRPQPVWSHCEISADITSWAQSNQCYEASEGALYVPHGAGARVLPGERFQYRWFADTGSGPLPGATSSVVWIYHPHDDEPAETNAGLLGAIMVTAAGKAKPDGTPRDVDREFVALFMIFDELHREAGRTVLSRRVQLVPWRLVGVRSVRLLGSSHVIRVYRDCGRPTPTA